MQMFTNNIDMKTHLFLVCRAALHWLHDDVTTVHCDGQTDRNKQWQCCAVKTCSKVDFWLARRSDRAVAVGKNHHFGLALVPAAETVLIGCGRRVYCSL